MKTTVTITATRQQMLALRDAMQLWLNDPAHAGDLAAGHPLRVFGQGLIDHVNAAWA